ncbi:MAG: hypothetical protein J5379_00530 [Clostridiales bacterium]|nr:hypothetical protein [Clostridiales bacterium]
MADLIEKIIYRVDIELLSPMNVSGGEGDETDADVLRNYYGEPFVSGSSLAGAFRGYLDTSPNDPNQGFLGYEEAQGGKMSRLLVSDLLFEKNSVIVTYRDGVGLDENKNVKPGAKFDLEIVDKGAVGIFFLELVVRDEKEKADDTLLIQEALHGLSIGDIRIGSKKTRGFGKMSVKKVSVKTFNKENYVDYGKFYGTEYQKREPSSDLVLWNDWEKESSKSSKYVHVTVPLKLDGCISIRQYQAKNGAPDYIHIQSNKKSVIPGTSFAGAIRSRARKILKEVAENTKNTDAWIDGRMNDFFGFVEIEDSDDEKAAEVSKIIFDESEIVGGKDLAITRTAISRFESSAKEHALYEEVTCVGGEVNLEISLRRDIAKEGLAIIMPALLDLQRGYLPIGGMVSIGRGIFSPKGSIEIDCDEFSREYSLTSVDDPETQTKSITINNYSLIGGNEDEAK